MCFLSECLLSSLDFNERNAGMAIACQIEKYGFYLGRTDKMFIFAHSRNAAANADSLP